MENSLQSKEKIDWISKAKGFAILGVVAVHTGQSFTNSYISEIASGGQFCVQLFFVISAFLAFKSLNKNEITNPKTYFRYLLHKITRLMPVLYTACLWHLIMYCIDIHGIPNIRDSIWRDGFFAVTFLNGFSYYHINPWYNWYIGDLIIFLVLAPFIKKIIDTPKKSVLLFFFSFLIGCTSNGILKKCGIYTDWYFYFWFPRQFPSLALGIFLYNFQKEEDYQNKINSLFTLAFIISFGFILSKDWKPILDNHVQYGILLLVFSYTLFNRKTKSFNWLKALGDNSDGIYLFHGCLLPIISNLINKIGFIKSSYSFILCYLTVVLLGLCCSIIVKKILEKPFINFLEAKFGI